LHHCHRPQLSKLGKSEPPEFNTKCERLVSDNVSILQRRPAWRRQPRSFLVANASEKPLLFWPVADRSHSTFSASLIIENFSLTHFERLSVSCTLRLPRQKLSRRLVIIAPGFLGFKDWGFFPFLAERLCLAGFATLAFSHALSGVRDNPLEITDAQAFSRNSTSQELKDWDLVLDSILLGRLHHAEKTRLNGFGIVGHSRGGSYGILMANRVSQIQSVVAWGAIQTFQRYDAETRRQWRAAGAWEVAPDRSGKKLYLGLQALDALEQNRDRLDVVRAIRSVNVPVLFIHGRDDKRGKLAEAQALWKCANPYLSRLHVIESAGHTFRTQHPLNKPSQPLLEAVEETACWFQRTVG